MNELKTLLIDDMREMQVSQIARTYADGLRALKEGSWDILYLDHDLGEPDPNHTGYGIMSWLEEHVEFLPGEIILITANPVGRDRMQMVINKLYQKGNL